MLLRALNTKVLSPNFSAHFRVKGAELPLRYARLNLFPGPPVAFPAPPIAHGGVRAALRHFALPVAGQTYRSRWFLGLGIQGEIRMCRVLAEVLNSASA